MHNPIAVKLALLALPLLLLQPVAADELSTYLSFTASTNVYCPRRWYSTGKTIYSANPENWNSGWQWYQNTHDAVTYTLENHWFYMNGVTKYRLDSACEGDRIVTISVPVEYVNRIKSQFFTCNEYRCNFWYEHVTGWRSGTWFP